MEETLGGKDISNENVFPVNLIKFEANKTRCEFEKVNLLC